MHVIIHAHASVAAAEALSAAIRAEDGSAEAFACDLPDFAATEAALRDLIEQGAPQVLVHNAGTHEDVPLAGMSEAQWRGVLGVTLDGFYAVLRPLLLPMMATRWGRIVAISSVSALMGNRGQV